MSKLETLLTNLQGDWQRNQEISIKEARQEVKDLMLELIDGLHNLGAYEDWGTFAEGFDDCQEQLRQKVSEL